MPFPELPAANDRAEARIVLTDEDLRSAARLLKKLTGADLTMPSDAGLAPGRALAKQDPLHRDELVLRARLLLHARSLRERFFNRAIFGEPAWEILLVLYVTNFAGERQTVGRLAEWIETPPTTVLRWLAYLEMERLIGREPHSSDRRICFIRLLDKGRDAIEDYLNQLPG